MICSRALSIFALTCLFCRLAWADDAAPPPVVPDPGIPNAWKEDSDPTTHRAQIAGLIQTEMDKLAKAADQPTISAARQWLVDERELASNAANTSSAYLDMYSDGLNKAFVGALSAPNASVRVRVNIGIICKEVTEDAQTTNLLPTALLLLKDKSDAVVLWGQRAALNLLRLALNNANANPADCDTLRKGIVDAIATHTSPPLAGILAYEAYWGLNPDNFPHGNLAGAPMQCLIETNLGLQQTRLELYKTGIPDSPEVDTDPSEFLLNAQNWADLTADQQLAAVQCASDLIALAGQRAAALPSNLNRDLLLAVRHEASYLRELAGAQFNAPQLIAVLVTVESLPAASRPEIIRRACDGVYPELQAVQALANLKKAPEINAGSPDLSKETAGATGQGG